MQSNNNFVKYLAAATGLLVALWFISTCQRPSLQQGCPVVEHKACPVEQASETDKTFGMTIPDWKKGIDVERKFWDKWLQSKGFLWPEEFNFRFKKQRDLQPDIFALVPQEADRKTIRILDCGAGPITLLGNYHPKYDVELIPTDPLAPIYDELLAKYNLQPYPRTQFGPVENIHNHFAANYFDVVHIQNALDHAYNPVKGILSMLEVLKPGGNSIFFFF
jgi:hypothetical protein